MPSSSSSGAGDDADGDTTAAAASAASPSSPSSPPSSSSTPAASPPLPPPDLAHQRRALKERLAAAVAAEDFASAAQLKAELNELALQDPLTGLRMALDVAVRDERYQDAARLRDQIRDLQASLRPAPPDLAGVSTASDAVTDGVRVTVKSFYVPAQSRPELGQYFFAYSVKVTNEGRSDAVMLNARHWVITDGNGKVDHVRGPGVVGEQPVLRPGQSFEYQSACPLFTPEGCMQGTYEMVVLDEEGSWAGRLDVAIGRFALRKPTQS